MKLLQIMPDGGKLVLLIMFAISSLLCSCFDAWHSDRFSNDYLTTIKFGLDDSTNITLTQHEAVELNFCVFGDVRVNMDSLKCMFANGDKPFYLRRGHFYCYVWGIDAEGKKGVTVGISKGLISALYLKEKNDTGEIKFYILPCSFLVKGNTNVLTDTIKVKLK